MAETDVGRLEQDVAEIKADLRRLAESIEGRFDALGGDVRELKGGFAQMSERMGNVEQSQRWVLGLLFGSWLTTMLAVLGLYFKGSL